MPDQVPQNEVTLEQAWHFLMSQFALRNPGKITQGKLALRALDNIMRHRKGWL